MATLGSVVNDLPKLPLAIIGKGLSVHCDPFSAPSLFVRVGSAWDAKLINLIYLNL